jgi:serine/threonine protein kinase
MENTENKVKKRVLESRYTLTPKHRAAISPLTAEFLLGCLEFDKNKRIRSDNIAQHPVFNSVKERVELLIRDVTQKNELTESQLRK